MHSPTSRLSATAAATFMLSVLATAASAEIGSEVAVAKHLNDGEEFEVSVRELVDHGDLLFDAMWTVQEGAGRPLTKGNGNPLADPHQPLTFPRNFNRLSAPDANSCAGCHNVPRGGGGGDIVANVFVLAQRFDFATFDALDLIPGKGSVDEIGVHTGLQNIGNHRNTLGMFGSGYIEMLARQMTADLQSIRDSVPPGDSAELQTKGVHFGVLARGPDGSWDTSMVEGLPAPSLVTSGADAPPSLVIRPFHQAGAVVSLREFSNNAFNHHHGIQSTERFGVGTDPDGDGYVNEMTRADVTAVSVYQAQLAAPGRVIPNDPAIERAILRGERLFDNIGCTGCHKPSLDLTDGGWVFTEPNPYNPPGNLRLGEAPVYAIDLADKNLDQPRLPVDKRRGGRGGFVSVPAYTDLKLHDITYGPDDPNREPLNMHHAPGSEEFRAGNSRFLTRKLWGAANEPPYFHHGQYTTLREAVEAHRGDAEHTYQGWMGLSDRDRNSIIEFLKSLQILPEGTRALVVDEKGRPKQWPPEGVHGARAR